MKLAVIINIIFIFNSIFIIALAANLNVHRFMRDAARVYR